MKNLLKIIRSTITSFLFAILTFLLVIHLIFTFFLTHNYKVNEIISSEKVVTYYNVKTSDNILIFIDGYIRYVFYKQDYPSFKSNDKDEQLNYELIKDKIKLEYKDILLIRKIYNTINNRSIYLIINTIIFALIISISILYLNFEKGVKVFSLSLITSGVTDLLLFLFVKTKYNSIIKNFINNEIFTNLIKLIFIYLIMGLVLFLFDTIFTKIFSKK